MLDMSAITLYYILKATPPFTDIRSRVACDSFCYAVTVWHLLVLAQTSNFCSGKPSPEALRKELSATPDSDHLMWLTSVLK